MIIMIIRCGVCGELVMFDNDHIAVHLKRGSHPRITHKDYNDQYLVDTRNGRDSVPRKKAHPKPQPSRTYDSDVDDDGAPKRVKQEEAKVKVERKSNDTKPDIWSSNQNYISGGTDSDEEVEEKPIVKKSPKKEEMKGGENLEANNDSENNKVVKAEDSSDNGVKSIQLGDGGKMLNVMMLFE